MSIYASRCKEHARNYCETFTNFTIVDFCERLVTPGMMGYRYLSKIKPKMKCPVKAGTFSMDKVDIFFGRMLSLPVEGYRWIIRSSMLGKVLGDKREMITLGCLAMNARIMASTTRKRVMKADDVLKGLS